MISVIMLSVIMLECHYAECHSTGNMLAVICKLTRFTNI
jgi:hypothetical protein